MKELLALNQSKRFNAGREAWVYARARLYFQKGVSSDQLWDLRRRLAAAITENKIQHAPKGPKLHVEAPPGRSPSGRRWDLSGQVQKLQEASLQSQGGPSSLKPGTGVSVAFKAKICETAAAEAAAILSFEILQGTRQFSQKSRYSR
eukprot:4448076-Pyramimonas_sp.AAC.1